MFCQLKKYLEKLHQKCITLFIDNPPKDLEIFPIILEIFITKGNLTLMPMMST